MELNIIQSNLEESQNSVEAFQLFWVRRLKPFYNFVECLRFSLLKTHSQCCNYFFRQFLIALVRSVIDISLVPSVSIPVAERSKKQFCGRLIFGIAGSNPTEDIDVRLSYLLCVV